MTKPVYGKQRTVCGSYSADNVNRNTSRVLADVEYYTGTQDKVRDAGGGSDYNSLPSDRPGYYTGPDGFKLGKVISNIDEVDGYGSRALQKGWHREAGFSAAVSTDGDHPSKSRVSSWPSRGIDSDGGAAHGSPKGSKFSWN